MSMSVWIAIGLVFIIVWGFIVWEIYTAPLYPDDYDAPFEVNGSKKKKEQNKTGFYNGKDDEWYPDQDIN